MPGLAFATFADESLCSVLAIALPRISRAAYVRPYTRPVRGFQRTAANAGGWQSRGNICNYWLFWIAANGGGLGDGGGSGIRTHDTVARIHAFQACAFS